MKSFVWGFLNLWGQGSLVMLLSTCVAYGAGRVLETRGVSEATAHEWGLLVLVGLWVPFFVYYLWPKFETLTKGLIEDAEQ